MIFLKHSLNHHSCFFRSIVILAWFWDAVVHDSGTIASLFFSNDMIILNGRKFFEARGCEIDAARAHNTRTNAGPSERHRRCGAAWRGAMRRVATLGAAASLSQSCAVRATTTREEEAPPLLAVARADATRRRAPVRPSRALVRVRTSTETRDPRPPGVVRGFPPSFCHSSSWRNGQSYRIE